MSASALATQLLRQYDLPRRMIAALAQDFTDEEARHSVDGQKPLVWYLAHVAITEDYLLTLYSGEPSQVTATHIERYGRGSDGSADFRDAPPKQDFLDLLDVIHGRMEKLITALSDADLDRQAEGDTLHPLFKTLGSALTLVVSHDAYHAGQIAVLRRSMGKDSLFG